MARKTSHAQKPPSGRTILCIDDQIEYLEATRSILEREGHRVFLATSGREGLGILERERVDVLLLDYFMPEMSAEDVLVGVRDPALQVVLLTGYSSEKPPRDMLDRLNIQGYCDKSRGHEELLLWVDVALRFGATVRLLDSNRQGLRQVLAARMRPEECIPLETELDNLLDEALATLGIAHGFVGICTPRLAWVPPSRLEETPAWADDEIEDLRIMSARGPWTGGTALSSQVEEVLLRSILEAPRLDGSKLSNGAGVIPLRAEGQWLGALYVESCPTPDTYEWDMICYFASEMAVRILNRSMATLDPVTGLQNRAFWRQSAWRELRSAFRYEHPISLLLVSVAGLDKIRALKWRVADQIMEAIGRVARNSIRGTDLAGRSDKDELLLLLPHTNASGASRVAEMLASRLEELVVQTPDGASNPAGAIGVTTLEPHGFPPDKLPKPMPSAYYPSMEQLLRARAAEVLPRVGEGACGFPIVQSEPREWPDPATLATRTARSTLWS